MRRSGGRDVRRIRSAPVPPQSFTRKQLEKAVRDAKRKAPHKYPPTMPTGTLKKGMIKT